MKYQRLIRLMLEHQIKARGIYDPKVLSAMYIVQRHLFLDESLIDLAYVDSPLPILGGQTISQPYIVAKMTQELELSKNHKVLEIGTGSGYQTAILAHICRHVYTVERISDLHLSAKKIFKQLCYNNITSLCADGSMGWQSESPFEAIIVTAAARTVPASLKEQLAVGGILIMPIGDRYNQILVKLYKKDETTLHQTDLLKCRFVKLIDEHGWEEV